MKVSNDKLLRLKNYYSKLMSVDFSNFDDALSISDESVLIEDGLKSYNKAIEPLQKRLKEVEATRSSLKNDDVKAIEKFNSDYLKVQNDHKKLLDKEVEVDLQYKIKSTMLKENDVKITPIDIKTLKSLNLFENDKKGEMKVEK